MREAVPPGSVTSIMAALTISKLLSVSAICSDTTGFTGVVSPVFTSVIAETKCGFIAVPLLAKAAVA